MDMLIPSADEARRYRRAYPRARVRVMGGRGHALLQEVRETRSTRTKTA